MIIYTFSLGQVALALGVFYVLSHGWVAWRPAVAANWLRRMPACMTGGRILIGLAALWFAWLMATIDLMEYTPHREKFVFGTIVLALVAAVWVRELLAVRALGILLLLLAQVLLDAAFLREEFSRLVITVLAYVYVIEGMLMVGMPYIFRDALLWLTEETGRLRVAAVAGVVFGLILITLAILVYGFFAESVR